MSWLLAGCYGLVLMNISGALLIRQTPRFIGVKTKQKAQICCSAVPIKWYKLDTYDGDRNKAVKVEPVDGGRTNISNSGACLIISELRTEDSGVYFCTAKDTWGPGSELRVVKTLDRDRALHRTNMKDGLIILQALLLAVCTAALMLRKQGLQEKRDSIYEEPEDEHIYEGLSTQVGDLYEELCNYQPEGAEAPWE
ncbi:unnamed protein product [Tetraodon nigroviridis]|uniref:(spotted green pufferfish) hypothetical protein n=1 Tax=Tetraodon nigroviridis TaxID=99883 RepID=Q4RYI4_TETNG|nr:unnamed protein product [Tetraodon nigroviridis]